MDLSKAFDQVHDRIKQEKRIRHLAEIALPPSTIQHWQARVRQANNKDEVFTMLDQFRRLQWTDQQRAQMSRTYINRLDVINHKEINQ